MRATLIVLLIVVLLAVVAVALLSRDAAGIAIGLAMGMLCTFPGLWVILAQRGEAPQVQRPALPEPPPFYGRVLVERTPVRPPPQIVDGKWRQLED